MEDTEVWKNIAKYYNYEVSSFGNVRNKKTGRILKQANMGGYYCVGLSNKITIILITHRLSALKNFNKIFLLDEGHLKS